jgi:hypothetical protein
LKQTIQEDVDTPEHGLNREKFTLLKQALNVIGFSNLVSHISKVSLRKPSFYQFIKVSHPETFPESYYPPDIVVALMIQQRASSSPRHPQLMF